VSNPSLNAVFQALPGGGFVVNGAPIPANSALVSAGVQLFLSPNWSLLAKVAPQEIGFRLKPLQVPADCNRLGKV
jgi:uncharacterized protein with beta-barrel porin domain